MSLTRTGTLAADSLLGGAGDDLLIGLAGNDTLSGGEGRDTLIGGLGVDRLLGGNGADVFRYQSLDELGDLLVDLTEGDLVDLSGLGLVWVGSQPAAGTPGATWLVPGTAPGYLVTQVDPTLRIDIDGDGASDASLTFSYYPFAFYSQGAVFRETTPGSGILGRIAPPLLVGDGLLTGSALAESLTGGPGDDTLLGGAGNDTLSGGGGDDVLVGGPGYDILTGGTGSDRFVFDSLSLDDYVGDLAAGDILDFSSSGLVWARDGRFTGVAGQALIHATTDPAQSELAVDRDGNGFADERLAFAHAPGIGLRETAPGSRLLLVEATGRAGYLNLITTEGPDSLEGGGGTEILAGGGGDDTLRGAGGADRLSGEAGDDSLEGGEGSDTLDGGAGDDRLAGGQGDLLTGGGGADRFVFIDMGQLGTITDFGPGDLLDFSATAIDYVGTPPLIPTYVGGPSGIQLMDLPTPGRARYADGVVTIQLGGFSTARLTLQGFTGSLSETAPGSRILEVATPVQLYGLEAAETLRGGGGADVLFGAGCNDLLLGGGGADSISGGSGDDTVLGGQGGDTLRGDAGADSFRFDSLGEAAGDTIFDFTLADRLDFSGTGFNWRGRQGFSGQAGEAVLTANGIDFDQNDDRLSDYSLALPRDNGFVFHPTLNYVDDRFSASATLAETAPGSGILVAVAAISRWGDGSLAGGLANDWISGRAGADWLFGLGGDDVLIGDDGQDTLEGGEGADRMTGGAGDDQYIIDSALDVVIEAAGGGVDTAWVGVDGVTLGLNVEIIRLHGAGHVVAGSSGAETLVANALGASRLVGGGGADTLWGGAGDDTLQGGSGDDLLRGQGGADRLEGGSGDDVYAITSNLAVIIEAAGEGTDTAYVAVNGYHVGAEVERIFLAGAANTAIGNDQANLIVGQADTANAYLVGGAGRDTLFGGASDDVFRGDAGDDVLYGRGGADRFVYQGPGWGYDQINGFTSGLSRLDFTGSGLGFSDLYIRTANGNSQVEWQGDAILLFGVASLTAADFLF